MYITVPVGTVHLCLMENQDKNQVGRPANPKLRDHLLNHAIEVLLSKGLSGFSMINVAKSAKASKETLYKHFGDKQGLLHAAIERDSTYIEMVLLEGIDELNNVDERLKCLARNYLAAAYTDHAIALQRLAYADGEFGLALGPLFVKTFTTNVIACVSHEFKEMGRSESINDAELFLGLVQGKMYNRIIFGVKPKHLEKAIDHQVELAWSVFNAYLGSSKA